MTGPPWSETSPVLDGVTVRARSRGAGPPIVFVHGVWVGGSLWDDVADHLPSTAASSPPGPSAPTAIPRPAPT